MRHSNFRKASFIIMALVSTSCAELKRDFHVEERKELSFCRQMAEVYGTIKNNNYSDNKELLFAAAEQMVTVTVPINERAEFLAEGQNRILKKGVKNESIDQIAVNQDCIKKLQPSGYKASIELLDEFSVRLTKPYKIAETQQFTKLSGNRFICGNLPELLANPNYLKPQSSCLYNSRRSGGGLWALQSTKNGILVKSSLAEFEGKLAILDNDNNKERNAVDGDRIESGIFEFTGIKRYQSLSGERSVYGFRRIDSSDDISNLRFYKGR